MSQEKGVVHLVSLLIVLSIIMIIGLFFLVNNSQFSKYIPESIRSLIRTTQSAPVAQYQNPLDKSSQYTNPFLDYKNPFDSLK